MTTHAEVGAPDGYCVHADFKPVTHWSHRPITADTPRPEIAGVCDEHAAADRLRGRVVTPARSKG